MNTQTQTQFTTFDNLVFYILPEEPAEKPAQYTAYDFGYEIDPDEVGELMAVEYSNGSFDQVTPQVEPDEFETLNHWFLS